MNWITAFRYCGGWLNENQIQLVRDHLDELGYETELDRDWIGTLRRGSEIVWRYGGSDRSSALGVISALRDNDVGSLNTRFGAFNINHLHDDLEETDEEETLLIIDEMTYATPNVGAATVLPLPGGTKK